MWRIGLFVLSVRFDPGRCRGQRSLQLTFCRPPAGTPPLDPRWGFDQDASRFLMRDNLIDQLPDRRWQGFSDSDRTGTKSAAPGCAQALSVLRAMAGSAADCI